MPFTKGHTLSKGTGRPPAGKGLTERLRIALHRNNHLGIPYYDAIIEKLLKACDKGDLYAIKEVFDRTEGKPAQTLQGDPSKPLELRITVAYEERVPRRSQETS